MRYTIGGNTHLATTSCPAALVYPAIMKNTAPLWRFMYCIHSATSDGIFLEALRIKDIRNIHRSYEYYRTCAEYLQMVHRHSTAPRVQYTVRLHLRRAFRRCRPKPGYIGQCLWIPHSRRVAGAPQIHDPQRCYRIPTLASMIWPRSDDHACHVLGLQKQYYPQGPILDLRSETRCARTTSFNHKQGCFNYRLVIPSQVRMERVHSCPLSPPQFARTQLW